MRTDIIAGLLLICSIALGGCTQEAPESSTPASASSVSTPPQSAPVILFNAYTSNTIDANGEAATPTTSFGVDSKVYLGVVVHGVASSADVKVEWSLAGAPVIGSEETKLPVTNASVATFELTKSVPLAVGNYKAIVILNGKPGWELNFNVGQ